MVSVKVGDIICNFVVNHIDCIKNITSDIESINTLLQPKQLYNSLVSDYNQNMKKVDQFNQAYYQHLPSIRQSNILVGIRRALLRFAVINAYHMYELYHQTKIRQDTFLEMLMYELLGFSSQGWKDFTGHLFLPQQPAHQKCELCINRMNASTCNHWCVRCKKSMYGKCFLKFHIK